MQRIIKLYTENNIIIQKIILRNIIKIQDNNNIILHTYYNNYYIININIYEEEKKLRILLKHKIMLN